MRVIESCAKCLYDKQQNMTNDVEYLQAVKKIIDNRTDEDTSPYLVYLFNVEYEKRFGKGKPYQKIKKKYNDLVLEMENAIRKKIEKSDSPLEKAFLYARIGNYIDFGAMNNVDTNTFLSLFENVELSEKDKKTMDSFLKQCASAKNFLLITDNCGEIVLDKLFIEQLKNRFPNLEIKIMVRGGEVLNDATMEDAVYAGIDKIAAVISNGNTVAGTVYNMLTDEAKSAFDSAEVILAKGQGNYESMCGQGYHIFYSFLCKCDLFTNRFDVPRLTGMFVEETFYE
ncbi:MAG: ARMT1-like domain-containing protein [Lachnospiraceae bacterium]|nr:ARMT1-like domain-containing protein [Lachnospiraceae bacterium]